VRAASWTDVALCSAPPTSPAEIGGIRHKDGGSAGLAGGTGLNGLAHAAAPRKRMEKIIAARLATSISVRKYPFDLMIVSTAGSFFAGQSVIQVKCICKL